MDVLILSRHRRLYSTRRLADAVRGRGGVAHVLDPLRLGVMLGAGPPRVVRDRGLLRLPDVVIPRIGTVIREYALAIVRQLELAGVPVLNRAASIAGARDKLRALQRLAGLSIPVPATTMVRAPHELPAAIERVGGPPVILKLLQGTQGIGVMLVDSCQAASSVVGALWSLGQEVLVQRYHGETRGEDVRVLVVGGEVAAAMRREPGVGEFRSNVHRGARIRSIPDPDPEWVRLATRATDAFELDVAGVDLLLTDSGPLVLEVNPTPGLEGIEGATGKDLAGRIVARSMSLARRESA